jgi:peptide deformylase
MGKIVKYRDGMLVEYEILKLVDFYDPILRTPTIPYNFSARKDAEYIAYSLVETMSHYGGLGLSANQVGLKDRICVINMGEKAWVLFNPEIIETSGKIADFQEGCLSYPGLYVKCNRLDHIKVRFQAVGGQFLEQEFDGLTAVCVQHELDHLDGIVYTSRISPINLEKAKRKVKPNLKKMSRVRVA